MSATTLMPIVIVFMFATNVFAQNIQDKYPSVNQVDSIKIEELHEKDIKASKARNFKTLLSLWTDDGVILPLNEPPIVGKKAIQTYLEKQKQQSNDHLITEYILALDEVKIIGEWAFEWGTFTGTVKLVAGGEPIRQSSKLFRILKRQPNGEWKIARAIWND